MLPVIPSLFLAPAFTALLVKLFNRLDGKA